MLFFSLKIRLSCESSRSVEAFRTLQRLLAVRKPRRPRASDVSRCPMIPALDVLHGRQPHWPLTMMSSVLRPSGKFSFYCIILHGHPSYVVEPQPLSSFFIRTLITEMSQRWSAEVLWMFVALGCHFVMPVLFLATIFRGKNSPKIHTGVSNSRFTQPRRALHHIKNPTQIIVRH